MTIGVGFNLEKPGAKQMIESIGLDYNKVISGKQRLKENQIKVLFDNDLKSATQSARSVVNNFD